MDIAPENDRHNARAHTTQLLPYSRIQNTSQYALRMGTANKRNKRKSSCFVVNVRK